MSEFKPVEKTKFGVFIGRMSPIHVGHMKTINEMILNHSTNHVILIGSCNTKHTFKNVFTYEDRRRFVKTLYPDSNIIGIPDFTNDDDLWFTHIVDQLDSILHYTDKKIHIKPYIWLTNGNSNFEIREGNVIPVFYGGCDEDLAYIEKYGMEHKIISRYDENSIKVSGTEIRDDLIYKREAIVDKIDKKILEDVKETFKKRWEQVKQQ